MYVEQGGAGEHPLSSFSPIFGGKFETFLKKYRSADPVAEWLRRVFFLSTNSAGIES